jgi:hypothetical protein
MAKFTLTLRKSLAARFSRIDSGSEISGSLVDLLASLEDSDVRSQDSEDTLPSSFGETKSVLQFPSQGPLFCPGRRPAIISWHHLPPSANISFFF